MNGAEPTYVAKKVKGSHSRQSRKGDSSIDSSLSDPLPVQNGAQNGGTSGDSLPRSVRNLRTKRSSSIMSRMSGKKSRRRRASVSTVGTQDAGALGRIELTMRYSFQTNRFVLIVNQLENLYSMNEQNTADPYVKVRLLFEGSVKEKVKTGIAVDTLNPVFDKTFEFDFHHNALKQYSLLITVKDGGNYGFFSKAPQIGQLEYALKDFNKEETLVQWFDLVPKPR